MHAVHAGNKYRVEEERDCRRPKVRPRRQIPRLPKRTNTLNPFLPLFALLFLPFSFLFSSPFLFFTFLSSQVHGVIVTGYNVRAAVAEYLNKSDADLVVVGTRNLGAVSSFIQGSFSSYISHHVEKDIVIVRNTASKEDTKAESAFEHEHV